MHIPVWLDHRQPEQGFPNPEFALEEPNGLLAVGGCLRPQRLLNGYRRGIFPWYSPGQPILWWSPNPRTVLFPAQMQIRRSLRKRIRNAGFQVSFDQAFQQVMAQCAAPRADADGTWITAEIQHAYWQLHQLGYAHSVEVWLDQQLVGGLYGVALGRVFYGESMFSRVNDASKVALALLSQQLQVWGFAVIDCQMTTEHLLSLGAEEISRSAFLHLLDQHCVQPSRLGPWQLELPTTQPNSCDDTSP